MTAAVEARERPKVSIWNDPKIRSIFVQVLLADRIGQPNQRVIVRPQPDGNGPTLIFTHRRSSLLTALAAPSALNDRARQLLEPAPSAKPVQSTLPPE